MGLVTWLCIATAAAGAEPPPVVGGEPVVSDRWQATAAIWMGDAVGCTGVLVAPELVLTAAHCDFGITEVQLATNDWTEGGERIAVSQVWSHERSWATWDVALIELAEPATTPPADLGLDCVAEALADGQPVHVVGFGATDEWGTDQGSILVAGATTVDDADCSSVSRGCHEEVSPGGELIAGGDGVDSCNGDSGGPLFLDTADGDFLVGITSRGAEPATRPCGDGGIYGRVDAIADWIEQTSGRTLARPDCEGFPTNHAPEPSPATIVVTAGERATVAIEANDPDPDDRHGFEVVVGAALGRASIGPDGVLAYAANRGAAGADQVTVAVSDDGEPALQGTVVVAVTVVAPEEPPPEEGCSCATRSSPGWLAVWLTLAILATRRQTAHSSPSPSSDAF